MTEPDPNGGVAEVRSITAEQTVPLRHAVLRQGRPVESARFAGDDAPSTRHFGAFRGGKLLGVASLFRVEMPENPRHSAFQLRGMATAREARGTGLGRALALACIGFAQENGVQLIWCNARIAAVGFYRKLAFEVLGAEFDVPGIGPHFRMFLRLDTFGF